MENKKHKNWKWWQYFIAFTIFDFAIEAFLMPLISQEEGHFANNLWQKDAISSVIAGLFFATFMYLVQRWMNKGEYMD